MPIRRHFSVNLAFSTLAMGFGCSVDHQGLGSATDGPSGLDASTNTAGTGGSIAVGTGGVSGTGAVVGTGGVIGTGGVVGTGGDQGTGGVVGTGGAIGTGGVVGTGGAGARTGSGGAGGRGGAAGTCGPANCPNGCCNGNMCVTNRTNAQCGAAGAVCAACGSCFQCSNAGACVVNPTSLWTITCVLATIAPTKPLGLAWDLPTIGMAGSAAPDPFCSFQLDGAPLATTAIQMNTFAPTWSESITPTTGGTRITPNFLMSEEGNWSIFVGDDDGAPNRFDDVCEVFPTLTAASFTAGTVRFTNVQSCTNLTIQLACAQ